MQQVTARAINSFSNTPMCTTLDVQGFEVTVLEYQHRCSFDINSKVLNIFKTLLS